MIDNQVLISAHRQAQLEAAKAAFFSSGGQVQQVEGFEFKPPPLRKHPEPGRKSAKAFSRARVRNAARCE